MSTLSTANIQSKAANTPPVIKDLNGTECGQFARAWVNFNGTGTVAIRDSFNVSSITDNGTGDYVVNFATALTDANYCAVASVNSVGTVNSSTNSAMVFARNSSTNVSPSTTSMACCAYHPANSVNQDVSYYTVAVFGG